MKSAIRKLSKQAYNVRKITTLAKKKKDHSPEEDKVKTYDNIQQDKYTRPNKRNRGKKDTTAP